MKKTLEAALVLAALALGAYVVRQALARRELALHPPVLNPALQPGTDGPVDGAAPRRGAVGSPAIALSRPPKPVRRAAVVPAPSAP